MGILTVMMAAFAPVITKKTLNTGSSNKVTFDIMPSHMGIYYGSQTDTKPVVIGDNKTEASMAFSPKLLVVSNNTKDATKASPHIAFASKIGDSALTYTGQLLMDPLPAGTSTDTTGSLILGGIYNTDYPVRSASFHGNTIIGMNAGPTTTTTLKRTTSVGAAARASGDYSTALGYGATASGAYSIALGDATASYKNSIAMGDTAQAVGNYSTAVGYKAEARSTDSTALGYKARAVGSDAIALGYSALANSSNSTALGREASASNGNSTALGYGATSGGSSSVALGHGASTSGNSTTALGHEASASDGYSTALGYKALASGYESIALGGSATASGWDALALGYGATASNSNSIALGYGASASGNTSIAIGYEAIASGSNSTALGYGACGSNTGEYSVCLGSYSGPSSTSSFSGIWIGTKTKTYGASNIYFGKQSLSTLITAVTSDRRLKNVGKEYKGGLDELNKLKFYNYTLKDDKEKTPQVGVIAQDLRKVLPNAVFKDSDGYLKVRRDHLFFAALNAIKTLFNRITELEKRNAELEKRLEKLEQTLLQADAKK